MLQKIDVEEFMSEQAFLALRDKWIDHANRTSLLSHAQSRIAVFIALRTNAEDRCSWWSVDKMANELQCSTKTVTDTTVLLESLNLLHVVRQKRGGNKYFIRWPYGIIT